MKVYLQSFSNNSLSKEMLAIAVDPAGVRIMSQKAAFYVFKIKDLKTEAAIILKQEMLSRGGEAALPRGTITKKFKTVDLLLWGTKQQFNSLIKKIQTQPFGLKEGADKLAAVFDNLDKPIAKIIFKQKTFNLKKRPLIMGILNVTPDSFSDGGKFYDEKNAVLQAENLLKAGADIIDIGAESTRPGAEEISAAVQLNRLLPVLKALKKTKIVISIDTTKAHVAEVCLKNGAQMINDISGLKQDKKMAKVIAKYGCPIVVMHRSGKAKIMQQKTVYKDLVPDIIDSLQESIVIAQQGGVDRSKIIIDPGIGFGKTVEQNCAITKKLAEFKMLGLPILYGASRKSMIGNILKTAVDQRLSGTLATTALAINNGAAIIRVHDVKENRQVAAIVQAVKKS